MRYIVNEKGYALLMVLMLILLFTVLGMGLLSMNINASKQFNIKEEQVQARHQAEMGVLHYEAVLKEKVMSSSSTAITCANIESILGTAKQISGTNYKVRGGGSNNTSCKLLQDGKKLEIKVKSIGSIGNTTEKEVEATFYAINTGGNGIPLTPSPAAPTPPLNSNQTPNESLIIRNLGKNCNNGGNNCTYDVYTTNKFALLEELETKQHSFHFQDHLVVKNLRIEGGSEDTIRVNKNLYISDNLDIQNHACLAVGGNLTVGKNIFNKNKNKTNIYVYGNFFLPTNHTEAFDFDVYVAGHVYQYDNVSKIYKEQNKISSGIKELTNQTDKECNVAKYNNPGNQIITPLWNLSDEINVIYN